MSSRNEILRRRCVCDASPTQKHHAMLSRNAPQWSQSRVGENHGSLLIDFELTDLLRSGNESSNADLYIATNTLYASFGHIICSYLFSLYVYEQISHYICMNKYLTICVWTDISLFVIEQISHYMCINRYLTIWTDISLYEQIFYYMR